MIFVLFNLKSTALYSIDLNMKNSDVSQHAMKSCEDNLPHGYEEKTAEKQYLLIFLK